MTLDQIAAALHLGLTTTHVVLDSGLGTTVVDRILGPYFGGTLDINPVTVISRNEPQIVLGGQIAFPTEQRW